MQVYRRSLLVMLKGFLMAPCSAVLVYFVLNIFVDSTLILFGVSVLVFAVLLYVAVFSENIRFELDEDGTLRYFQKGRLKKTYKLEEYLLGYYSKSDRLTTDITLRILHAESGEEESLDCSPLGERNFHNLFTSIKAHTKEEPEVLKV